MEEQQNPLTYEIIKATVAGEKWAAEKVIAHYDSYPWKKFRHVQKSHMITVISLAERCIRKVMMQKNIFHVCRGLQS